MTKQIGNVKYLSLQKSGSSFCVTVLDSLLKDIAPAAKATSWHKQNKKILPDVWYLINVRNPWAYYTSVYAYSMKTSGPDIESAVKLVGPEAKVDFRKFLEAVLLHKTENSQDSVDVWKQSNPELGLLTFRLMDFLQSDSIETAKGDYAQIEQHFAWLANHPQIIFLRQENLYEQLRDAVILLQEKGAFGNNLRDDWREKLNEFDRYKDYRNTLTPDDFMKIRQQDYDYRIFYDQYHKRLVEKHDRLIVKYFGYRF